MPPNEQALLAAAASMHALTFTLSSQGNCCPGFMHMCRCLGTLVRLAALCNRTAILPPPWLLLHRDHNFSPLHEATTLPRHVKWMRYINLSATSIAEPHAASGLHVPTADGHGASVIGGLLVPPETPWQTLLRLEAPLIALDFRPRWGSGYRTTDCSHPSVGALGSSALPLAGASSLAARIVQAIAARLGPFAVVHIRRGRAVTSENARTRKDGYSHEGCGTAHLLHVTSPSFIAALLQRSGLARTNLTLLVMTNEQDAAYHRELHATLPRVLFDWQVPEMRRIYAELQDNYLAFQVGRHLGPEAVEAIGTASCYFVGGCTRMLCDGECTCKSDIYRGGPGRRHPHPVWRASGGAGGVSAALL